MLTLKTVFLVAITAAKRVCDRGLYQSDPPPFFFFLISRFSWIANLNWRPRYLPWVLYKFFQGEKAIKFHMLDIRCVLHWLDESKALGTESSILGAGKGHKASKRTIARLRGYWAGLYVGRHADPRGYQGTLPATLPLILWRGLEQHRNKFVKWQHGPALPLL